LIYTISTSKNFQWAYLAGALLIAGISWIDDLYSISFVWRFCVHFGAAILIVSSIGAFDEIYVPIARETIRNEGIGKFLTVIWIVWLTNAYNFMDGIDGLAGVQTICCGISWLIWGILSGADSTGFYGGVIASTGFGFLIQNWQPAKIFMGDVGSAFLGFSFAVIPLLFDSEINSNFQIGGMVSAGAIFLNWLFLFDTIYTFFRRLFYREKVWQAHRGHLYQKLVIGGYSHRSIAGLYGFFAVITNALTICWIIKQAQWEFALVIWIVFQSIGILGLLFFCNKSVTE
jgi:UDP-N-acetylmuramyl pentapeptide phosphotransferase/UDP-N-acetylglucosamine-1-phosphate transferase